MNNKELHDKIRTELESKGYNLEELTDKDLVLIWDVMTATKENCQ
jgi:hypothetical protein